MKSRSLASRLGLHTKIGLGVALLVAAISLSLAGLTGRIAKDALLAEARKRGQILVTSLAARGVDPLLSGDFLRLKDLVDEAGESDHDVVYAFYLDSESNVLAHTFDDGFPVELICLPEAPSSLASQPRLIDNGSELILDFTAQLNLAGDTLGQARVGLSRDRFMSTVSGLTTAILTISLVVLFLGVSAGLFLARSLTRRLESLRLRTAEMAREHLSQTPGRAPGPLPELLDNQPGAPQGDEVEQLSLTFEGLSTALTARLKAIKDYQEQLIQSQKMESVGKLAGGVAHEINTPLGIILGYAQLLLEDAEPGSQISQDLAVIEAQTKTCRKIVADLLGFSRRSQSCIQSTDINASLKETAALVEHSFEIEQVDITLDLDYTIPLIPADLERLRQVWMNLLANARDAVGTGGAVVLQSRLDAERGLLRVVVADDGPGIDPLDLGRIFDPFFSTKPVGQGTGLGLSVSFGIVVDHNGRIFAQSPLPDDYFGAFARSGGLRGPGTAFIVELPLKGCQELAAVVR